ncbi:MAG: APC family permease [Candidatus Melainabacteria bacterium]|nr:APC family permease [Candidatus Melainabacteria bacterium]
MQEPSTASTTQPASQQVTRHKDELLSWWLAAAIVGADIGTSVFYSPGIVGGIVGNAAPLMILVVCLLMWLFKFTYEEGCAASPFNGGAYMMVLQTVGRRMAMVVGALTILSYLATAAVSAISGAHYLDSFDALNKWPIENLVAVSLIPVVFFGFLNIVGIKEPAKIVLAVAAFHFTLLLVLDAYGLAIAISTGANFGKIFDGIFTISPQNLIHGFAAAFLGITGFEAAAQIVEQLKPPTWLTLRKVYLVVVSLVAITAPLTAYLCVILLTPAEMQMYSDNVLSGLALKEFGHTGLVVLILDACLVLFAAVNTAYAGCIGLCTTMAKQGNLPGFFLRRWADDAPWPFKTYRERMPFFQGYPNCALTFMFVTIVMICLLKGEVKALAEVYGMAFLAVMMSFCFGVILLRARMPLKVARSPYRTRWIWHIGELSMPVPAVLGLIALTIAEVGLFIYADDARILGLSIFLLVLMVTAFYRLGVLEGRLQHLPDLRLGLGKFQQFDVLPEDLPTYVLCTAGAKARNLTVLLLDLLEHEEPGEKEVVIFHAEEEAARRGIVFELLQRVVSQQVAPKFKDRDLILTVKVLPETLIDGMIQLKRYRKFRKIFLGTGQDPTQAREFARELETNTGVHACVINSTPQT